MTGGVNDFQLSSSQVEDVPVAVQPIDFVVEWPVFFDFKLRGRFLAEGFLDQPIANILGVALPTALNPVALQNVGRKTIEQMMPPRVIPMGMARYHIDREFRQFLDYGPNISYSQTGVDQDGSLSPDKQIGMNFHPLPILAYAEGGVVQGVYREPVVFQC